VHFAICGSNPLEKLCTGCRRDFRCFIGGILKNHLATETPNWLAQTLKTETPASSNQTIAPESPS
jgi:hypothetical protein